MQDPKFTDIDVNGQPRARRGRWLGSIREIIMPKLDKKGNVSRSELATLYMEMHKKKEPKTPEDGERLRRAVEKREQRRLRRVYRSVG